jgi:hypothetical protein
LLSQPLPVSQTFAFTTTKFYSKFAIQLVNISGGTASASIVNTFVSYSNTAAQSIGKYAYNYLGAGDLTGFNSAVLSQVPTGHPPLISTFDNILTGLCNIFGLSVYETIVSDKPVLTIDEFSSVFLNTDSLLVIKFNETTIMVDSELLFDTLEVGSEERARYLFDSFASCERTTYVSSYIETKNKKDITSPIYLDPLYIMGGDLKQTDTYLVNVGLLPYAGLNSPAGTNPQVRITRDLTILNNNSPKQLNWVHHEARIIKRNEPILFASGTRYLRIISGSEGNQTVVNYSGDSYGPLADSFLALGTGAMSPKLIEFETSMTPEDYQVLLTDRYKRFVLNTAKGRIKSIEYNPASGKAICKFWII